VEALDLGADDYITKPFSTRELIARVRAAIAASNLQSAQRMRPLRSERFVSIPSGATSTNAGQPVHLTRKEFDILHCLMIRAGRVVTYAGC